MIARVAKRKANSASASSFKTLRVVGGDFKPQEQPKWLKNNPHPYYLDLWDKDPKLFWQTYSKDKANGTLRYLQKKKGKPQREWIDFSEIKFKKTEKKMKVKKGNK